jgi:hypothetical protein
VGSLLRACQKISVIDALGPANGAAMDRQRAVKTLAAVAFSLVCAGCTETPRDCREEVAAAFERLRTSGRSYRKETVIVVSDQQTYHAAAEYVPPDRMREITNIGAPGYGTVELIRIGPRAWSNESGWREWESNLAQEIYGRGAGMDVSVWPDRAVPEKTVFKCLGRVEFRGMAYIGYRSQVATLITTIAPRSEEERQKLRSKLQQMPQEWRTVLLDWHSALPAHDLVAEENKFDNPRLKIQYSYPNEIKIEPPVQ